MNQRNAFMHENLLDVRVLMLQNQARSGSDRIGMPRMPMPKRVMKTPAQLKHEMELKEKAVRNIFKMTR